MLDLCLCRRPCYVGRDKGFTLIELMIGIAIIGILMMLAMPSYSDWIQNTRIRNSAESILSGLQKARQEAVHRNLPIHLNLTGTAWTLCESADTCDKPIDSRAAGESASDLIKVTSSNVDLDEFVVVFDPFGRRTTPAAADGQTVFKIFSTSDSDGEKLRNLTITINASGASRMCDPKVSAPNDPRHCVFE